MSAPKPRIWWDTDLRMWREQCACGYGGRSGNWQRVITCALEHSQTHTGERVADQLDRHALARRVDSIAVIDAAGHETDYSIYQQGVAKGFEHAERLIRRHLVKEAT